MQFSTEVVQDYLEQLSSQHKGVAHNVDGKRAFARFQTDEHITELRNKAAKTIVVVADISWRPTGEQDENLLQCEMIIRFSAMADKVENAAAKLAAMNKSEAIAMQFAARMKEQHLLDIEADECGPMHHLQPMSFVWEAIEEQPWLLNHYGWDMKLSFKTYMPQYDAAQWI